MRQSVYRLFLVIVFLVTASTVQAQQPVLTLLYTANTYGVIKPCPS